MTLKEVVHRTDTIYKASNHELIDTQRIIGHTSPATTARYLETDSAQLDALIIAVAV
jgi:hypothetical protein